MPRELPNLRRHLGAAGLDEAGRGPLAGPVVAAAVILPRGFDVERLDDSKRVPPARREELAQRIKAKAAWAVAVAEVEEIDRVNILWASMAAMCRALEALPLRPRRVVVDGDRLPPDTNITCRIDAVVKADSSVACVAAASILAKTTRDALMRELDGLYPGYGFGSHFGYSTPEHQAALRRLGPCPIHRRSFWRVREAEQPCLIAVD